MAKKILLCLAAFVFLAAPLALAMEAKQPSPWTTQTTHKDRVIGKLDFGFKNGLTGWTEIFSEPYDAWKEKSSVPHAIGRGIGNALYDTIGGALHLVTFPVDKVDIQLPEGGTDTFS